MPESTTLRQILQAVARGECSVTEAEERLRNWPADDLGFACLDHHRGLRTGIPEVIFAENKSAEQIVAIVRRMTAGGAERVLATRLAPAKAQEVLAQLPNATYHPTARALTVGTLPPADQGHGCIGIIAAGTSDLPVAEEALLTARFLGQRARLVADVGVAGLHRLQRAMELFQSARVLVVVAGMEGALPSVVAGLVRQPVIGVPTSVGYGTGLGGVAALLTMLNSCAPGVAVVNIDNGFGAACMAAAINQTPPRP